MPSSFGSSVRSALETAAREAAKLGQRRVGTEHLLLGVLRQDDEVGVSRVLSDHGLSRERCAEAISGAVDRSEPLRFEQPLPLRAEAQRALDHARREAIALGDEDVQAAHLLLALLRHRDALSARLLERLGVEYATAKRSLANRSSGSRPTASASTACELEVESALALAARLAPLARVITLEVVRREGSRERMRVSCEPERGERALQQLLALEQDDLRAVLEPGGIVRFDVPL